MLKNNCKIILASHLGRPQKNGKTGLSLLPVKHMAEKIFNQQIEFLEINHSTKQKIDEGEKKLFMLENLRFDPGEETNSQDYANLLSSFAEIYINEAPVLVGTIALGALLALLRSLWELSNNL